MKTTPSNKAKSSCATAFPFRVLYIDSNKDDQFLTRAACKRVGESFDFHCVSTADEGISFLQRALRGDGVELPDLILLEVRLRGKDGFDVLNFRQSEPDLLSIPVVVYSDWVDPEVQQQARQLGADYIWQKEFDLEIGKKLSKLVAELRDRAAQTSYGL
jgi:CheY-like chemotaxis protein